MKIGRGQFSLSTTRLILITSAFITVYFGFTIVGDGVHQYELNNQNADLQRQITAAKYDRDRLQALQQWMQSDQFIELMARQQGMVRPGDIPISVAAPTPSASVTAGAGQWWEHYFESPTAGQ